VGSEVLGPGKTEMDGSQVVTLLYEQSPDPTARWRAVLKALLVAPPELQASDLLDTDDAATAAAIVSTAAGAQPTVPPTQTLAGAVTVFPQPRFDTLVTRIFGTEPPDPVQVENGNGEPGVGEQVAALVIPAGFRVVLSGNAQDFNHPTTDVTANGIETQDEAQRVVDALGVGTVTVSQVPSGIADVTIVVGKDFSG
jgi:hypothetical protein